jgi:hypothetical protein
MEVSFFGEVMNVDRMKNGRESWMLDLLFKTRVKDVRSSIQNKGKIIKFT